MSNFTASLTPLINDAKAAAIAEHIRELHKDFFLLAELTDGATTYEEIAQRLVDRDLISTHNPSDTVNGFQNICEEFIENVGTLLWMPERDPLSGQKHPSDDSTRSAPLRAYLLKTRGE